MLPVILGTDARLPQRKHATDAGLDLHAAEDVLSRPLRVCRIKTNLSVAIPQGHVALVLGRSSLADRGVFPIGGVIDADYRGGIDIILANLSDMQYYLRKWDRIAQLVIFPIALLTPTEVEQLAQTQRNTQGFGSTGT